MPRSAETFRNTGSVFSDVSRREPAGQLAIAEDLCRGIGPSQAVARGNECCDNVDGGLTGGVAWWSSSACARHFPTAIFGQ